MSGEFEFEDRRTIVAEETAAGITVGCALTLCFRLECLTCKQIAERVDLRVDDNSNGNSLIVEILHHKGLVVIREKRHFCRTFDVGSHILTHGATDDVESFSRIVIEIAKIIGNSEHEEHALRIGVTQQNRIA